MCFSSPSTPAVTTASYTDTSTETSDESVQAAKESERQRRLAASNQNTTLVTGGAGVSAPASTGLKTAFGA